jgi:hypothetical protein
MLDDWNVIRVPGFAAVGRAPHKQTAARCSVRPVVEGAELVEGHVANEGAPLLIARIRALAETLAPDRISEAIKRSSPA